MFGWSFVDRRADSIASSSASSEEGKESDLNVSSYVVLLLMVVNAAVIDLLQTLPSVAMVIGLFEWGIGRKGVDNVVYGDGRIDRFKWLEIFAIFIEGEDMLGYNWFNSRVIEGGGVSSKDR